MWIDRIKVVFVGFFTTLNAILGVLAIPVYILVATNITDYITGILASIYRGEKVESYRGYRGIAKKVCMWLLVAVGVAVDYCIIKIGEGVGITSEFTTVVAIAVVFWLIANELISILENINDIGTPMPPFLLKIAKLLKEKTETDIDKE